MEKKIDFYKMKRELHYKMVDAITALLKTHGLMEFDLLESDADHAFIQYLLPLRNALGRHDRSHSPKSSTVEY